jgi:DNA-binding MarR family transcriptional regulator
MHERSNSNRDGDSGEQSMRFNLTWEERLVLTCLQEQDYPLPSTTIADATGLDHYDVLEAISFLAEKDLIITEDGTAELSPSGKEYNLFDDESIDELAGHLLPETEILIQHFLDDPGAAPSYEELEVVDGLKPEQIERAIEELERSGYPARTRVRR